MNQFGTCIVKNGETIRQSKNLRGMLEYARVSPVAMIETRKDGATRGILTIHYADGAKSIARFASHSIMIDWLRNRISWRGAIRVHHDGDMGYLTKPGIIAGGAK